MSTKSTCAISSAISFLTSAAINCTNSAQFLRLQQARSGNRRSECQRSERGDDFQSRIAAEPSHSNLLTGFCGAARLGRSTISSTIFAQLSELAARAVGLRRLLNQLGVIVVCLFLFSNLFRCLRRAIQTSESSWIDFQRSLKLPLRFLRPIQFQQ